MRPRFAVAPGSFDQLESLTGIETIEDLLVKAGHPASINLNPLQGLKQFTEEETQLCERRFDQLESLTGIETQGSEPTCALT